MLCSLVSTFCTPILLHAAEVLDWNTKSLRSLKDAYSQAFPKIFTAFDKNVVQQCQFYMGLLPINLLIDLRKLNFLSDIWSHIAEVKAMCSFIFLLNGLIIILVVYWLNLVYHLIQNELLINPQYIVIFKPC